MPVVGAQSWALGLIHEQTCSLLQPIAAFGKGSPADYTSGVAGVDARRATPPDPRLPRWGLLAGASSTSATHFVSPAKMLKLNQARAGG